MRSIACTSGRGTAHPRRCILPLVPARQKDAHCPPPLTQSLEMPGGMRKRVVQTNACYNSTRHLAPKDLHYPSPPRNRSKRPKGLGTKVSQKTRQNTATSPKAAASSPWLQSTAQQAQYTLRDIAKRQRPKRCCRTTYVEKYRSTDAARVSSPQNPPSKARETCLCREKREVGVVAAARKALSLK